jgi:hypothetical protein
MCELDRFIERNEEYLALGPTGRAALFQLYEHPERVNRFNQGTLIMVTGYLENSKEFLSTEGINKANEIIDVIDMHIMGLLGL